MDGLGATSDTRPNNGAETATDPVRFRDRGWRNPRTSLSGPVSTRRRPGCGRPSGSRGPSTEAPLGAGRQRAEGGAAFRDAAAPAPSLRASSVRGRRPFRERGCGLGRLPRRPLRHQRRRTGLGAALAGAVASRPPRRGVLRFRIHRVRNPHGSPGSARGTRDGGRTWTALRSPARPWPASPSAPRQLAASGRGANWPAPTTAARHGDPYAPRTRNWSSSARALQMPKAAGPPPAAGRSGSPPTGGAAWRRAGPFPGGRRGRAAAFVLTGAGSGWALVAEVPARRTSVATAPALGAWALDRTLDGGRSWTVVATWSSPAPAQHPLLSLAPLSAIGRQRVSLLSAIGALLNTPDGGRSWQAAPVAGLAPLRPSALQFVTPDDGWMLAGDGGLLKTTDRGRTWAVVPV